MPYDVEDVLEAGCTLEPMICRHCGSDEVTFHQYIGDASCAACGEWQLDDEEESKQ